MKQRITITGIILLVVLILGSCTRQSDFPVLKGPYLGQKPPGTTPEIFVPGVVSTDKDEINAVFSHDGKEFYFSRDTYANISRAGRDYTIFFMKEEKRGWSKPEIAPFALEYMNADMCISSDNRFLFYCSDRPLSSEEIRKGDADIWFVERQDGGWSEPRNAGPEINSGKSEWYPSITTEGVVYFSSQKQGYGGPDIHCARFLDGKFEASQNIGKSVNSEYNEGDVFIAADESFLIFVSSNRPEGLGSGDLYLAFRKPDRSWSVPINMGAPVNTSTLEYCPMVSPDRKYLFFTSRRRGNDDIYWVDAKIIEDLKPDELK